MKFKKFIVSASAIVASSGVLATVLTSCSKANIDEDLKIELNNEGKFANIEGATFQAAIKAALSRSSTWTAFKQALSDELVYKWYENRAAKDKNDTHKNTSFRSNLDEWKYQIDEDYNNTIDNLKSKYGANYKFYLQNEYLAANGGTEETYKHAKLVEKVKTKFIDDAFATILFGISKETGTAKQYSHIFTNADLSIDDRALNNPANWEKLGFYAKVDGSFNPGDKIDDADIDYLAEKPQGDYATLQDYVFNRWFITEKPFFSAASLFKYSAPNTTQEKKLTDIYNGAYATVPDSPNEAFPFFGGQDSSETYKGTLGFYKWYEALNDGKFQDGGMYDTTAGEQYNGTITIGSQYSEDGQTLLLCSARNMIGGSEGALYIPYAISSASLYRQLMVPGASQAVLNSITQALLQYNVYGQSYTPTLPTYRDDARILSNFFYSDDTSADIQSYIDLYQIYGGTIEPITGFYHCPIFKSNSGYSFLYGITGDRSGVRYITNNVQASLGKWDEASTEYIDQQPWILELNEAGVHAQTIDGYLYVQKATSAAAKQQALMNVIKYRLMQKKCGYNDKIISSDLFESKLKSYFTNNFADIVLELALDIYPESNIFRDIESYKTEATEDNFFLHALIAEQKLSVVEEQIEQYLELTILYDRSKKAYDAVNTANEKIYAYRKDQIANSKEDHEASKKIFDNGLLAPLPITYSTSYYDEFDTTHHYESVNRVVWEGTVDQISIIEPSAENLGLILEVIRGESTTEPFNFIAKVCETAKVDDESFGFNPQVQDAKKVDSNRYWFQSPIVDKMMYGYMGGNTVANGIKADTYDKYEGKIFTEDYSLLEFSEEIADAMASTYMAGKLLTGDKNYATYDPTRTAIDNRFFTIIGDSFADWLVKRGIVDGEYCDDVVNFDLYLATVAYLYKDNFANLFNALNNKIANDEAALVGYVNKYANSYEYAGYAESPLMKKTTAGGYEIDTNVEQYFYRWAADVDNIYDQIGYSGGTHTDVTMTNARTSYDQYWHVIPHGAKAYAGFTGIQTAKSNQLDSASGLQDAAFKQLAKATDKSVSLNGTLHAQNDGAFFAWAGEKDTQGQPYSFEPVSDPSETPSPDITNESFDKLPAARKLARKIANASTVQDVKDIAKALGDAFYGDSIFKQIGYGTLSPETKNPAQEYKYKMLSELLLDDGTKYKHCFERLVGVELHGENSQGGKYCFESGSNGYKMLVTQINKSDITERKIFPTFDATAGWQMPNDAGLTLDEFWYIFCSIASESSIQQLAIADAVKEVYGPDKLVVYDAQLYNQFDSVWIKDWVKKPIGGEGA